MSEKYEVQNLEGASEATEPLDAAPDAVDAGQVAQGEPRDYGDQDSTSVDPRSGTDVQNSR